MGLWGTPAKQPFRLAGVSRVAYLRILARCSIFVKIFSQGSGNITNKIAFGHP
jgi:hypothetical protein